jgi:hypothetical protein
MTAQHGANGASKHRNSLRDQFLLDVICHQPIRKVVALHDAAAFIFQPLNDAVPADAINRAGQSP